MGKEELYRFTWLRTFDNPASIRIQKHGNNIMLFAKVSSAAGGSCKSRAKEHDLDNISLVSSAGNRFVNHYCPTKIKYLMNKKVVLTNHPYS